jgi:hypothetical protein
VVLSGPVLAPAVEGAFIPTPLVRSADQCLGPGAVLNFYSGDVDPAGYNPPGGIFGGWRNYVTVLANGGASIGTLPLISNGGTPPRYYAQGSLTLPANTGGIFYWTLRQTYFFLGSTLPPRDFTGFFDTTRWTCSPTLATNTTCLPPAGGSVTLTGQVNRANDQIDVGFDVDVTQAHSRSRTSFRRSGTRVRT